MTLDGSKTEKLLKNLLAAELEAQARYRFMAEAAQKTGHGQIADLFSAIGENEAEHARQAFLFLERTGDVRENLDQAMRNETIDFKERYPEAEKTAAEEGFDEVGLFFRRARDDERRHERQFSEMLRSLEKDEPLEGRTVGHSALTTAHFMLPHHANPAGTVHGGELMKLMDNAATVVAVRHGHSSVVTALVDELRFVNPVRVGNVIFIDARMTFVSRASMEIRVDVVEEDLASETKRPAVTAYFVMVAVDGNGSPSTTVPPLILCTEREEQLFHEAGLRYRARRARTEVFE